MPRPLWGILKRSTILQKRPIIVAGGNFLPVPSVEPCEPQPLNRPEQQSDQQCIAAVRGGDRQAYGSLVIKYQDRLFNTLARLVGSADDAQDLTQEALTQAYLKLDSFQGNSAFYTWLYRIAFNLAMSHRRKRIPVTVLDGQPESRIPEPVDRGESPEELMATQQRIASVKEAIGQLPDDQRQVVVLREIEGCDYQQIAEILDIPLGTVRSRLFRARMELKNKLASIQLSHD